MARKKKIVEEVEELVEEVPVEEYNPFVSSGDALALKVQIPSEEEDEELSESLKDLDDDDSPQYSLEEEVVESVVQAFVEFDSKGEIDLLIPMREHDWDDDVFVITEEYAERMLTNASARLRNSHGKVAFAGHDRQNRFIAYLASWMLRGEGNILYLPEELADYEPLQKLEKLDDAPEGFVAFSAK